MLTRRRAAIAAVAALFVRKPAPSQIRPLALPPAVQVIVGEHKDVTVRFPGMNRPQLVAILSTVITPEEHTGQLARALDEAGSITIVLTSEKQ